MPLYNQQFFAGSAAGCVPASLECRGSGRWGAGARGGMVIVMVRPAAEPNCCAGPHSGRAMHAVWSRRLGTKSSFHTSE